MSLTWVSCQEAEESDSCREESSQQAWGQVTVRMSESFYVNVSNNYPSKFTQCGDKQQWPQQSCFPLHHCCSSTLHTCRDRPLTCLTKKPQLDSSVSHCKCDTDESIGLIPIFIVMILSSSLIIIIIIITVSLCKTWLSVAVNVETFVLTKTISLMM